MKYFSSNCIDQNIVLYNGLKTVETVKLKVFFINLVFLGLLEV